MNNIQELYKTQRFLTAIKHNSVFNYSRMIELDYNEKGVQITLGKEIDTNLKTDEKKEVLKMIYEDLRGEGSRKAIEGMVIAKVAEQLENCKERVRMDIGVEDILEDKSDPRD